MWLARPRGGTLKILRIWPLLMVVVIPVFGTAAVNAPPSGVAKAALQDREREVWRALARNFQFADVPHGSMPRRCEDVQAPEALATPDPLLAPGRNGMKVRVSFIIGTDGRVHSPLILQSAGPSGDRHVLQTVRNWRYRPATCNGVPTETEGKIEFSSR